MLINLLKNYKKKKNNYFIYETAIVDQILFSVKPWIWSVKQFPHFRALRFGHVQSA